MIYGKSIDLKTVKQNAQKYFLNAGEVYGDWKLLELVETKGPKSIIRKWRCENIITGKIKLMEGCRLGKKMTPEQRQKYYDDLKLNDSHQLGFKKSLFNIYLKGAEGRGHPFLLTYDEFYSIIQKPCYFCGIESCYSTMYSDRGSKKEPSFEYNGVDRLDSKKGYVKENCVSCCKRCNYMKHLLNEREFLEHICKIYNYKILGQ